MVQLKQVRLINWYGFSQITVPVGFFTLIAGKNGNGKSVFWMPLNMRCMVIPCLTNQRKTKAAGRCLPTPGDYWTRRPAPI